MRKVLIKAKPENGPDGKMQNPTSFTGSPDGIRCEVYEVGKVYDMPDSLAASFVMKGKADFVANGNGQAPITVEQEQKNKTEKTAADRKAKLDALLKPVEEEIKKKSPAPENKALPEAPKNKVKKGK